MHGLSLHNLALDFSDCWQSCAQASKQFSIKSIAAAMDANSEEYATKVWCSNNRALWFLIWLGLLCLPKQCSRGHNWKFSNNQDGAYCHLHCTAKLDEVYPVSDEEAEEEKAPVYKRCNGSPGAITGSSISICHVRLHRRNTCEPCIGFAQMRLKSRS